MAALLYGGLKKEKTKKETMEKVFKYIKAAQFFPKYAPLVVDWKKKLSGKNGRGNPLDFSEADKENIKAGLKQLAKDLQQKTA